MAKDADREEAGVVGSRSESAEDFGGERGLAHAARSLKRGVMVLAKVLHHLWNQVSSSEEALGWLGREPRGKVEVAGEFVGEEWVRGEERNQYAFQRFSFDGVVGVFGEREEGLTKLRIAPGAGEEWLAELEESFAQMFAELLG